MLHNEKTFIFQSDRLRFRLSSYVIRISVLIYNPGILLPIIYNKVEKVTAPELHFTPIGAWNKSVELALCQKKLGFPTLQEGGNPRIYI